MDVITDVQLERLQELKTELTRFMMSYKFGLAELSTKIDILMQEFQYIHDYNPIEHVKSRIKTPDSILKKVYRKGLEFSIPSIRENIQDIAGIRITCSFISDIYKISNMLQGQKDVKVLAVKDYIKNPKPNGYKSLHLILQVPVFMSDRVEDVCVEIQIRTIAMDFWASLEHKIYYKYNKDIPQYLKDELKRASDTVTQLDERMESIQNEVNKIKQSLGTKDELEEMFINNEGFYFSDNFLSQLLSSGK